MTREQLAVALRGVSQVAAAAAWGMAENWPKERVSVEEFERIRREIVDRLIRAERQIAVSPIGSLLGAPPDPFG